MGEAKRRKLLGLMPSSSTFEAELEWSASAWKLSWKRAPDGVATAEAEAGLLQALPLPAGWPAEYRTRLLRAGRVRDFINSREDLEAIEVPTHLRVSGEWLSNFGAASLRGRDPETAQQFTLLEDKKAVRVRELDERSSTGWQAVPHPAATPKSRQYLMQHPMARERGELLETFQVTHHREGLVMVDPEPPAALLEALESVALRLNGTGDEWAEAHATMMARLTEGGGESGEGSDAPTGIPESRRLVLELRERAPLNAPGNAPLIEWGEGVVVLQPGSAAYSMDGAAWYSYFDPEADPQQDELDDFFQQILETNTAEVTVYADGRVEWADEVAEAHGRRLREQMLERTGAGDTDKWAEFARRTLAEAYEDTAPALAEASAEDFPVPAALRFDIPLEAIEDESTPIQFMYESAVSYDGETWADMFLDELPQELAGFAAQD